MPGELGVPLWRRVPNDASSYFNDEERAAPKASVRRRQRLTQLKAVLGFAVVALLVVTRGGGAIDENVASPWAVRCFLEVFAILAIQFVVEWPIDHRLWQLNVADGLTQLTWRAVVAARVRELLASTLIFSAVLIVGLTLVGLTSLWWLALGGVLSLVPLAFSATAPLAVISNSRKFRALEDAFLRARFVRLCAEAGVRVTDVLISPNEAGDTSINGYVVGVGRRRRIVLNEASLESDAREVEVMLAHEVAHARRLHVWHRFAILSAHFVASLFVVHVALESSSLLDAAGVDGPTAPAAIPLVAMLLSAMFMLQTLVISWQSRMFERVADVDALTFSRDPEAFERFLRHMARLAVHPVELSGWQYVRHTHPPIAERMRLVELWRHTRTAAILMTDVVGSTAMVTRLGDRRWYELLREHGELVRSVVAPLGGKIVKDTGDGFLIEMPDVGAAVLGAINLQRSIAETAAEHEDAIHIRAGVHAGDVVRDGDDVRGREVHVAARVLSAAGEDEIVVSKAVRAELDEMQRVEFGDGRVADFKGIGAATVYPVQWRVPVTV